uniref:Glutaredoxin domain-containing protein n=2 Tax=Haemonchus TaxID=6288 RepID=A0A0N4X4R3_HAEPC
LASNSAEQSEYESNSVTEPETVGSVYGGEYPGAVEEIYTPPQTAAPTRPTTTPRPRPTTTRPRPQTTTPTTTQKPMTAAITAQSLTQQIRRLPAVLYLDSRAEGSAELEKLLRDTYSLPLVAFYVDKISKPQLAQKYLHQLTAHKTLPYLFICGTFIGSEQHIQNYHKNGQIPQLVEYVCGEEHKKPKKTTKKTTNS